MVSAFRMLTDSPEYLASRFDIRDRTEQARHLGEYLVAHELGHALIGLTDFIVDKPGVPALRGPASIQDTSECLMHTDEQGGFRACRRCATAASGTPRLARPTRPVLKLSDWGPRT